LLSRNCRFGCARGLKLLDHKYMCDFKRKKGSLCRSALRARDVTYYEIDESIARCVTCLWGPPNQSADGHALDGKVKFKVMSRREKRFRKRLRLKGSVPTVTIARVPRKFQAGVQSLEGRQSCTSTRKRKKPINFGGSGEQMLK